MPTLLFSDRDTLRLALGSGGVPPAVSHAPAWAEFDPHERLRLTTDSWLPKEALIALARLGVEIAGSTRQGGETAVCCWHELLPLERASMLDSSAVGHVIFDLPCRLFADFASRIGRLGGGPWSYRWADDDDRMDAGSTRVWLKTIDPPYHCLLAASDQSQGGADEVRAYVERAPGVWIEAGWGHPLAQQIHPPAGKWLLLRPSQPWQWLDDRPFIQAVGAASLLVSIESRASEPVLASGRPLQLIAFRLLPDDEPREPNLWLVEGDDTSWLHGFVSSAAVGIVDRFTIAVAAGGGSQAIVLRAPPGKELPPLLVERFAGYRPLQRLSNLYIPCGARLTPLPRRDVLRGLLAADSNRLTWLKPLPDGAFRAESLPISAFKPLVSLVEYVSESTLRSLTAWQQSGFEELEPFIERDPFLKSTATTASAAPAPPAEQPGGAAIRPGMLVRARSLLNRFIRRKNQKRASPAGPATAPAPEEAPALSGKRVPSERTFAAHSDESARLVKGLEARFLGTMTNLTPQARLELWPRMAAAYIEANNPADAATCWLNAVWEQTRPLPAWIWGWFNAEAAQAGCDANSVKLADLLAATPAAAAARAVTAYIVWSAQREPPPAGFRESLGRLQRFLDDHEDTLPVRAAWLARTALVGAMRGDVLALAHTRDRVLQKLKWNGLTLDVDAPAFVRFAESADPDRYGRVRTWLAGKPDKIRSWIEGLAPPSLDDAALPGLNQFGLTAETTSTAAYADLLLAWGLSRLGEKTLAAALRDRAWSALDERDAVHRFLKSALDFRIHESRDGKAQGAPFPPVLLAELDTLDSDNRYRIEHFLEFVRIAQPNERVNAFRSSTLKPYSRGRLEKRLIELPDLPAAELNAQVRQFLAQPPKDVETLSRFFLAVLQSAPVLEPALVDEMFVSLTAALDLLSETSAPSSRRNEVELLEKALLASAIYERPESARLFGGRIVRLVQHRRGAPAGPGLESLTRQVFRCFRKLGLRNEALEILTQVDHLLTNGEDLASLKTRRPQDWSALLRTLLPIAAAYYRSGDQTRGFAIIDQTSRELYHGSMSLIDQTALAYGYASTLGQVPVGMALGRFDDLFSRLKKIAVSGFNTHYTIQPLKLVDTVVLAVVSEDFVLGPSVRAWLDDEEFLVRQRIQKDLGRLLEEQGV